MKTTITSVAGRALLLASLLLSLLAATACEGAGSESEPAVDVTTATDATADAATDAVTAPDTAAPPDAASAPDTTTAPDTETVADAGVAPDTGPPVGRGLGWVWTDPSEVELSPPVMVHLPHVTGAEGRLTGPYADVFNCVNEPGGVEAVQYVNGAPMTIALCNLRQTVTQDPDGNYLSVEPPTNWKNPNDPFAEVQMYFHVNRVHDWFAETHGFTGMDRPLKALVNLQVGLKTGNYVWLSIDNAAYMPAESIEQLGDLLGAAPPIEEDAIIFAQGPELDLSYDGDVVYHEYTHAVIGGERLWGTRADAYGADAAPLSLNEAHADYFTASLTDDPRIGFWSLGKLDAMRDLREERRCPDHVIGESHWDGQIYSSALWAIREALGAEQADAIVFDALLSYEQLTGFDDAAEAVIANAADLDPPRDEEVAAIFARHGLPGCDRVVPAEAETIVDRVYLPGTYGTGVPAWSGGAPAYVQASFAVSSDGVAALTIEWDAAPDGLEGLLGLFGYETEPVEIDVALKRGGEAVLWSYEPGGPALDADAVLPATRDGEHYSLTVAGSCLTAGRHTLQLVNRSGSGASMRRAHITELTEAPDGPVLAYDCAD